MTEKALKYRTKLMREIKMYITFFKDIFFIFDNLRGHRGGVAEFLPPTPSFRRTGADFGKVYKIASAILHEMV